jgi:hypothetical protein
LLLREYGWRIAYFGANTPLQSLARAVGRHRLRDDKGCARASPSRPRRHRPNGRSLRRGSGRQRRPRSGGPRDVPRREHLWGSGPRCPPLRLVDLNSREGPWPRVPPPRRSLAPSASRAARPTCQTVTLPLVLDNL